MADIQNGRCHDKKSPQKGPPFIQNGKIILQAHDIGWIVSGCFTIVAVAVSFWLIGKHLQWYTNKSEQRYIVRILFMVPLYAVISLASYLFWNDSTPLLLVRDCYEATVLMSFFYLLLTYLSPDPEEQKAIFRKVGLSKENDRQAEAKGEPLQRWMFPLQRLRTKPKDGLYFLQIMKWGVLQYCVVRPATTLAAVILDYVGLYCNDSYSPAFGHLYITTIVSISVSVAMYCLLQMYMPIAERLKPHKPLLKLIAVKAVVFLTFWQSTFLGWLADFGVVKDTEYMTADNINIGIGAILETFEMMLFAILHIYAFTYRPYFDPPHSTPRLRALGHAMNFGETVREIWAGTRYSLDRARGRETDVMARREAVREDLFGWSRWEVKGQAGAEKGGAGVEETVERQWLGVGDDGYGLGYQSGGQRDTPAVRIERELDAGKRRKTDWEYQPVGLQSAYPQPPHLQGGGRDGQRLPWSHHVYSKVPLDVDAWTTQLPPPAIGPPQRPRSHEYIYDAYEHDYEDPPPPSAIKTYRSSRSENKAPVPWTATSEDPGYTPSLLSAKFDAQPELTPRPAPSKATPALSPLSLLAAPLPSTPSDSSARSDSFFGRAFASPTEPASSAEMLSTGPSSSQSHRTHVRLAPEPTVLTRAADVPRRPVFVPSPGRGARGAEGPAPVEERYPRQGPRYAEERTAAEAGGERLPRHAPRRAQIVLPAPLAPALQSSTRATSVGASNLEDVVQPSAARPPVPNSAVGLGKSVLSNARRQTFSPGAGIGASAADGWGVQKSRRGSAPPASPGNYGLR